MHAIHNSLSERLSEIAQPVNRVALLKAGEEGRG
jgi:hypothetical protein